MNIDGLFETLARRGEPVVLVNENGVSTRGASPCFTRSENGTFSLEFTFTANSDAPTSVYLFSDASRAPLTVDVLIRLEAGASVRFTEYHIARGGHAITWRAKSELSASSSLATTALIDMRDAPIDMIRKSAVGEQAVHHHALAAFTADASRIDTAVTLSGSRAKADVSASVLARKGDVLCKTTIEHFAPESEGFINHRGVALENGTLIFEGAGSIRRGMRQSVARQQTKGIVLGDRARLDAYPLLHIDEHDVSASHGAAIGKIDENQLHYMMSRGLRREEAERLIIAGYFHAVSHALHQPELGDRLRALLAQSIG